MTHHLPVKGFLQPFGGLHDCISVSVLRLEVGLYLGIRLLTQPEVIVNATVAVDDVHFGYLRRDRRLGGGSIDGQQVGRCDSCCENSRHAKPPSKTLPVHFDTAAPFCPHVSWRFMDSQRMK